MTDEFLTLCFVGGICITRKRSELFALQTFKDRLNEISPSGKQVVINWSNVIYVRKATQWEIDDYRTETSL